MAEDVDARWSGLMAAAQSGNKSAYDQLLRDIVPYLRGVVRKRFVGAEIADEIAEDIVQDILLSLHRVRRTYDASRSFRAWLVAIAHRRSVDALRVRRRRKQHETSLDAHVMKYEGWADSEEPMRGGFKKDLDAAIAQLPKAQHEAIRMVKLRELSLAEASAASGMSIPALKIAVYRAMKFLRENLAKE